MLENKSVGQLSTILTVAIVAMYVIGVWVMYEAAVGSWSELRWIGIVLVVLFALLSYLLIKSVVQRIVMHKVKPIYKLISDSNKSVTQSPPIDDKKEIEEVREEVIKWAEDREEEIAHLASLRDYRKNFVGNISHELKTPIFSIQGYLLTLLEGGLEDEKINKKYLKRAAYNAERLQRIVEDLEQINSLESGDLNLEVETFDIRELAKDVIEDLSFMSVEEEVDIQLNKSLPANQTRVVADKNKVRQVLLNLLNNAIKHGDKGVEVNINFFDVDDKIFVEIEDNGKGIEAQHLNHLFDRFYRVDKSRNRKHGGSGLGLSIVKHIIEAHDQSITVRSELGKGSAFTFSLQRA